MGSRLRPSPESVLECFLEVAAPTDNEGPEIKFLHPTDFEDKEALKAIPRFCYPCVASTELAVQHYTFVLTDIEGKYRFGFCRYSPDVRTCLCILSYLPWFKIFYELLNRISDFKRENEMKIILPLLNHLLNHVPPKPGSHLTIPVTGVVKEITLVIPDTTKLPSIPEDRNLTDYFAAVEPANMICIFASMFFERRIIVTSKKLHLLTACTYGAASLLYPMHWQHMFVPIVPPHLLDYCCAPMPFLVGVHSSLMPKVRHMPLDEVVILDADTNQVESPFDDISQLPLDTVSSLKSTLKKPVYPIDDNVSKAFLSAMVSLIGGYRDALRLKPGEKIFFDKDVFVQSKSNSTRHLLEFILQLQLFEQFISERLEMLNAGRGFNDAFEDQIGLQAENKASWRSQYQLWLKETMKSGGALLDKTEEKMKKRWKNVKTGIKSHLAEVKADIADKLKGKDEDELGEEPKRSNTCPDSKQFTVSRLSPFSKRRSVSPSEFAKLKLEGGSKVAPPRPPPPRPYSSDRRPRTSAFSTAGGKSPPELLSRRSAPDLTVETPVGELISLDDNFTAVSKREINQPTADSKVRAEGDSTQVQEKHTNIEINQASTDVPTPSGTMDFERPQFTLQRAGSEKQKVNTTDTSLERCQSSPSRQKPAVPKRPPSVKKNSQLSVDAILETGKSAHMSSENLISPLRPVSLSLLQDTVASLAADTQEFLFTDSKLNSLNLDSGGPSTITSKTALQSTATQNSYPQIDVTTGNNLQATALPLLELRRGSGPYDNLQRNIGAQQLKLDTASADCRPEEVISSLDSWVSFN